MRKTPDRGGLQPAPSRQDADCHHPGQTQLLHNLALRVNDDLKSRVTYSTILKKLNSDEMAQFIANQLDLSGLPHNIFTENTLALVVRSSDGILRAEVFVNP
jgi:type II secretory pathway predicted ATPase ExeA